jgi:hypothetical protein
VKVGDRVQFKFNDCCLEVKGEGVVDAINLDGDGNARSVVVNGIKIGGGMPTDWWQSPEFSEAWKVVWGPDE